MKQILFSLFFVLIAATTTQMYYRNGYDPMYNQMLGGAIPGYVAQMHHKIASEKQEQALYNEIQALLNIPEGELEVAKTKQEDGNVALENEKEVVQSGETTQIDGQQKQEQDNQTQPDGLQEVPKEPEDKKEEEANTEQEAPADLANSGEYELPSGVEKQQRHRYSDVLYNNYKASKGLYELPLGDYYYDEEPADFFGAGDSDVPHSVAPFRVTNDSTTKPVSDLSKEMNEVTKALSQKANQEPLSATNKQDEATIKEILNTKGKPDDSVVEQIKKRQQDRANIADPYEISTLHKLNEKMKKAQQSYANQQAAQQPQQTTPQVEYLKNMLGSVRALRRYSEKEPTFGSAYPSADELRLIQMENTYKQMADMMRNRY